MNTQQVATGGLLLFLSCIILLESGVVESQTPLLVAAFASLGLASGTLLFETAKQVRSTAR